MPWSRPFDDPIPLPNGRLLVTLNYAANYVTKLPKAEQQLEEWQAAVGNLIHAAATLSTIPGITCRCWLANPVPCATALP